MTPRRFRYLVVYGFYLILAIAITWPLARHLDSVLAGGFLTDAYQLARHSWWIQHAIGTGQPVFDQPAMAYPDGMSGALVWANPFQFFPTWLFDVVLPLPTAYNLALLLRLALNGWAMFFLVHHLTGRQWQAAILAGIVFLTYPAVHGRIYGGHLGVLFLWPMPLYVYSLFQLRESAERRWFYGQRSFVDWENSATRPCWCFMCCRLPGCCS
jgi:hypothetical protein